MNHYQRHLLLSAPPAAVYRALTTQEGARGWWTQSCDIASTIGGRSTFRFNRTYKVMENETLVPDQEVRWHCVQAHIDAPTLQHKDEWVGTHIVFRLSPQDNGKTRLDFEHVGLIPDIECFELCRDGWNHFLGSLQGLVDTGRGNPFLASEQDCAAHSTKEAA